MTRLRFLTVVLVAAMAGACTTTTPYQAAGKTGLGYTDQRLEAGKYRVTFQGNSITDRALAENAVLYRAAELTLANGDDHFILVTSTVDTRSTFNTTGFVGGGFGPGFFYGGGFGGGFGGLGGFNNSTTQERLKYTVGAVVTTHKGPKPADNAMAFDARSVIESIGPSLTRPKG
ncbi:MAG: hypothetical protein K2P95_09740 [Hyphomonadaceae bacterium]|nr:hypothetical protein [Hyphomonadaceae bacterium]